VRAADAALEQRTNIVVTCFFHLFLVLSVSFQVSDSSGCGRTFRQQAESSPAAGELFANRRNLLRLRESFSPTSEIFPDYGRAFRQPAKSSPTTGELFANQRNLPRLRESFSPTGGKSET